MAGPARKVRKSLVLDPWGKESINTQLFQDQLGDAQVSLSDHTSNQVQVLEPFPSRNIFTNTMSLLLPTLFTECHIAGVR